MSDVDLLETERRLRAAFDDAARHVVVERIEPPLAEVVAVPARERGRGRGFLATAAVVAIIAVVAGVLVSVTRTSGEDAPAARARPEGYDVTVFMQVQATPGQIDGVRVVLEQSSLVHSFFYWNKAQELREFKQFFQNDPNLVNNITEEALPSSFRVTLRSCNDVTKFAETVGTLDGVDSLTPPVSRHRQTKPGSTSPLTPAQCRAGRRTR